MANPKKQQKHPQKLEASDACMLMHTALRKVCDSPITSATYNLIHLLSALPKEDVPVRFDPWLIFGALVVEQLPRGSRSFAAREAISKFSDRFEEVCDRARADGHRVTETAPRARIAFFALNSMLSCFDSGDIEGLAAYLD